MERSSEGCLYSWVVEEGGWIGQEAREWWREGGCNAIHLFF